MADLYNMSFIDNITNPLDIITGLGTVMPLGSEFLIGHLILLSFFLIFLALSAKHDFLQVVILDSLITSILAILFYVAGLIPLVTVAFPVIVLFISFIIFMVIK